jgi:hypothetical protein
MSATNKRKRAPARITATDQKSSAAIFRNIPAHNAIVIMQTTQTAFHKQRKCDTTNNGSVITANRRTHNAIVISRSHRQAFVTFRNISSAYLSYRLSLYSTFVLCDSSGLALVRVYYSTPVLPCGYDASVILPYRCIVISLYVDNIFSQCNNITIRS